MTAQGMDAMSNEEHFDASDPFDDVSDIRTCQIPHRKHRLQNGARDQRFCMTSTSIYGFIKTAKQLTTTLSSDNKARDITVNLHAIHVDWTLMNGSNPNTRPSCRTGKSIQVLRVTLSG